VIVTRAATVLVLLATSVLAISGVAYAAPVEDEGADCPIGQGSVVANSRLPDPFTRIDGTRINTIADWRCRRAEIKDQAERYVYGEKPGRPAAVSGTVSRTGITVNVTEAGRSASFSASVDLPSGTGPFPAVVVIGGFGADTAAIKAAGAAVISYDPLAVGREGTPRTNKQGAFYSVYGASSSTGLLLAWAWGVSRIIDVIEQAGGTLLRADATGVTGCSRYGKGAIVAGAFDQRIALTMPVESGTGGTPIFRGVPGESGAQPLSSAYGEQPWLGDAFGSYTGNPSGLPIDTHELVGMVAPRGLFIMDNPHISWLAARSSSVAALGGAEIYKALGAATAISYWSDVSDGTHCASRAEWREPLQNSIRKFLGGTGSAPGVFRISSRAAGNLAEWRTWQTPTLTGGSASPSVPASPSPTVSPSPSPSPSPGGGACAAAVTLNQWNGGFVATVRVTAGAAALAGWTVSMTLPSGAAVTSTWNASASGSSGAVGFTNAAHNGALAAGGSTEFGFQGTGSAGGLTPACAAR
jgi:hypothetical protein